MGAVLQGYDFKGKAFHRALENANNADSNFVPLIKRTKYSKQELKYLNELLKAKYAKGRE